MQGSTTTIFNTITPQNVDYVHRLITSEVFTIIIETAVLLVIVYFLYKYKYLKDKISLKTQVFSGIFASFSTIPYVWYIFPNLLFPYMTREQTFVYSEPFVFVVEAIFYRFLLRIPTKYAFIISFVANMSSYLIGPVLRAYGIWFYW